MKALSQYIFAGAVFALITGCTSTAHVTAPVEHQNNQPKAVPVFIMPNCQSIGEETICQWITPGPNRGAEEPNAAPTPKPRGIAL